MNKIVRYDRIGILRLCSSYFAGPAVLVEYNNGTKIIDFNDKLIKLFETTASTLLAKGFVAFNHHTILQETKKQIPLMLNRHLPFIVDILNENEQNRSKFWVRVAIFDLNENYFLGLEVPLEDSPKLAACPFSFPGSSNLSQLVQEQLYKLQQLLYSLSNCQIDFTDSKLRLEMLEKELSSFYDWLLDASDLLGEDNEYQSTLNN